MDSYQLLMHRTMGRHSRTSPFSSNHDDGTTDSSPTKRRCVTAKLMTRTCTLVHVQCGALLGPSLVLPEMRAIIHKFPRLSVLHSLRAIIFRLTHGTSTATYLIQTQLSPKDSHHVSFGPRCASTSTGFRVSHSFSVVFALPVYAAIQRCHAEQQEHCQ